MSELKVVKATKKPVTIEAVQYDGTNGQAIQDWAQGHQQGSVVYFEASDRSPQQLSIGTIEGVMRADEGWWIIRGVAGEFYPCRPDVFDATYTWDKK